MKSPELEQKHALSRRRFLERLGLTTAAGAAGGLGVPAVGWGAEESGPVDCGPPPETESICDDGVDDDCDAQFDCNDTDCCFDAVCSDFDNDEDGWGSCDCDDDNGAAWDTPGEVVDLRVDPGPKGSTMLSWSEPLEPGGDPIEYETIRSLDPAEFMKGADCIVEPDPTVIPVWPLPDETV